MKRTSTAIERDAQRGAQARRERADNLEKAEAFKQERGLTDRPAEVNGEEELRGELARLQRERAKLAGEIERLETEAETLDDLYAEQRRHEEALANYERDYDLLVRTADLLRQADRQLKDRYVAPDPEEFCRICRPFRGGARRKGDDDALLQTAL